MTAPDAHPHRPLARSSYRPPSLPLRRLALQLSQQDQVALPAIPRDRAGLDAFAHPAARFGAVAAVRVAAVVEEGTELGKAGVELPRVDAPEPDLAEPGRIHQVAAGLERQHDRGHRRVAAPAGLGADLGGAELEAGLDSVEQARLPAARRPGDDRDVARQRRGERGNSLAGADAGGMDGVAGAAAALDERGGRIEVHLV